jgi:hypothetical protein
MNDATRYFKMGLYIDHHTWKLTGIENHERTMAFKREDDLWEGYTVVLSK